MGAEYLLEHDGELDTSLEVDEPIDTTSIGIIIHPD